MFWLNFNYVLLEKIENSRKQDEQNDLGILLPQEIETPVFRKFDKEFDFFRIPLDMEEQITKIDNREYKLSPGDKVLVPTAAVGTFEYNEKNYYFIKIFQIIGKVTKDNED